MAPQAQNKVIERPVDWDELYPGRFIKAGDFKGKPVTLTISAVRVEELEGDTGKKMKGILSFQKTDKSLALNKTNGLLLKAMFGRSVQDWVGKRVTFHAAVWNGEPAIRVYGSPEIDGDMTVAIQLPRKRPFDMELKKTGAATKPAPKPEPEPEGDGLEGS